MCIGYGSSLVWEMVDMKTGRNCMVYLDDGWGRLYYADYYVAISIIMPKYDMSRNNLNR